MIFKRGTKCLSLQKLNLRCDIISLCLLLDYHWLELINHVFQIKYTSINNVCNNNFKYDAYGDYGDFVQLDL